VAEVALFPGWLRGPGLLPALRTLYAYTGREPDRATGYLFSAGQYGQLPPAPWPGILANLGPGLLDALEATTGIRFVVACFQAYLDGSGCGWHSDRDWDAQAVLSLGVTRTFGLRRVGGGPASISAPAFVSGASAVSPVAGPPASRVTQQFFPLAHGDLLVMPPGFQQEWEHCVPAEDVPGERCSLVFRSVTQTPE
jgi:alkylated DNA repair dioxygenase AlkB